MNPDLLLSKHRGRRILLDSNLLIVLLVGTFQRTLIPNFKRTSNYTTRDFDLLQSLVSKFRTLVVTPHILTEVNGLANSLPKCLKHHWAKHFREAVSTVEEVTESATVICKETSFLLFGLTDAAIQSTADLLLVLTADSPLATFLRIEGLDVLSFEQITDAADSWDLQPS